MTTSLKYILGLVLLTLVFAFTSFVNPLKAEIDSASCTVSTSTSVTVGHQASSLVLATSSSRAWAQVQVRTNETNLVFLNFSQGAIASTTSGFAFGTSTEDENDIEFGRNTDFPYVGAVTGATNLSTTTILVTECNY
jgi:hypothetical protein